MNYKDKAKRLDCTFHIWKYGFKLFGQKLNGGRYLIQITSLDDWIFDANKIIREMANDDYFKIKFKDK